MVYLGGRAEIMASARMEKVHASLATVIGPCDEPAILAHDSPLDSRSCNIEDQPSSIRRQRLALKL